jgi:hypothetical protein
MKNQMKIILTVGLSIFILINSNICYCYNDLKSNLDLQKEVFVLQQTYDGYDFNKHYDIKIFINDLAKAVSTKDKNAIVFFMMNVPLKDEYGDNPGNHSPSLGCKTTTDIYNKFDLIFTKGINSAIMKQEYRGYDTESMNGDVIENGEFLIEGDYKIDGDSSRPHIMLGIKKVNGIYKIYAIKFYS